LQTNLRMSITKILSISRQNKNGISTGQIKKIFQQRSRQPRVFHHCNTATKCYRLYTWPLLKQYYTGYSCTQCTHARKKCVLGAGYRPRIYSHRSKSGANAARKKILPKAALAEKLFYAMRGNGKINMAALFYSS